MEMKTEKQIATDFLVGQGMNPLQVQLAGLFWDYALDGGQSIIGEINSYDVVSSRRLDQAGPLGSDGFRWVMARLKARLGVPLGRPVRILEFVTAAGVSYEARRPAKRAPGGEPHDSLATGLA